MANVEVPDPRRARDSAEFTAALRDLKDRSGLTYRRLEERAAEHGDVLPRSTLADVLRGRTLPRPELLAAFVRACGDGDRTEQWLDTRERLAREGDRAGTAGAREDEEADGPPARPLGRTRRGRLVPGAVAVLTAAALAGLVWVVTAPDEEGDSGGSGRSTAAADPPAGQTRAKPLPQGRVQIRPVSADGLCLTDGPADRYRSLVAVQRPCDEVAPQETRLVPLGGDAFRIQWHHPDHGYGCLKALTAGPGAGLLEPWDACEQTSRFRFEPAGPDGSRRYAIRVEGRGCVGIGDAVAEAGTEAVVEPCRREDRQVFVVRPAP